MQEGRGNKNPGLIGVETIYGAQTGKHRVLDALTTLAFNYPSRAVFFRSELENYLLLARERNTETLSLKGSYAGAIGIPQFMPSSYRRYAVDFDSDCRSGTGVPWSNKTRTYAAKKVDLAACSRT